VIRRPGVTGLADRALEESVIGSFSRFGYAARSRLEHWSAPPEQSGRVHLVTGASSGIGRALACRLGSLGAEVWVVGRDDARTRDTADAVRAAGGRAEPAILDITDRHALDSLVDRFAGRHDQLHGLVHVAGALSANYATASDGMEMTVATALVAPFRLTSRMIPMLVAGQANVVVMSSGGMYLEPFDLDCLVSSAEDYDGPRTYARAKRAQVVLARAWASRYGSSGVASYACHPGWVKTPGLSVGLPTFARWMSPLLRTPDQGADTAAWLAAGGARSPGDGTDRAMGGFFHDRRLRSEHRRPRTRDASSEGDAQQLWAWCHNVAGLSNT
jgi:dehydrogenase/reductase SDR family member 12